MIENIEIHKLPICELGTNEIQKENGRSICTRCQNQIHDFRNYSINEITEIHASSKSKVCGIYADHQVSNKSSNHKSQTNLKTLTSSFLSLTTILFQPDIIRGQSETLEKTEIIVNSDTTKLQIANKKTVEKKQFVLKGTVKDSLTKEGLISASIYALELKKGTSSDVEGNFELLINSKELEDIKNIEILFKYLGYENKSIFVSKEEFVQNDTFLLNTEMKEGKLDFNDIHITSFRIAPPPKKNLWQKFIGIFKKKH